jgi:spore maturation protein CgeB
MNLVVFGLSMSSSWGNGHATLWRGLARALGRRGHRLVFFERDVPYYARHRDLADIGPHELVLYEDWHDTMTRARRALRECDVAMVTSYCPDGRLAAELVMESPASVRAFYDLDTPVTLSRLQSGEDVDYVPKEGLAGFDLVLSYTGGRALDALKARLGARLVVPLYGSVDPDVHHVVDPVDAFRADLSYLGTYAEDRQAALDELFLEPARLRPDLRFLIGGAQYPESFSWTPNLYFVRHLPPPHHAAFYSSSRFTLNVTRRAMADMGWCPSGRLFEAASCGAPVISDSWEGLDAFFVPGREILVARTRDDVLAALSLDDAERRRIAVAARDRALTDHTADQRARDLEAAVALAASAPAAS